MPEKNMADVVTKQELEAAKIDVKNAGEAVNEKKIVNPRYGEPFKSLPLAIQEVIETGGFEPFATEALLKASVPILAKKAAKALDTKKVWLWDGTKWNDTGLSEYDLANNERKELIDRSNETTTSQFINDLGFVNAEISDSGIHSNNASILDMQCENVSSERVYVGESTIESSQNDLEVLNSLGFSMFSTEQEEENNNSVDKAINASEILISNQLVAWENEDLVLHVAQLISRRTDQIKQKSLIATLASLDPDKSCIASNSTELRLNANLLGSSAEIAFYDPVSNLSYKTNIAKCAVAPIGGGAAIKVVMIGDSITNRGGADIVSRNLASHGYTPTMIGTISGTICNGTNPNTEDGLLGEAREGSQIQHWIYALTSRSVVAVGDETAYLAMTKADKQNKNPFVRVSTELDDQALVFNGHIFDMRFYLNRFGFTDPDVVYINLGTNDITAYDDTTSFVTLKNAIARISVLLKQTRVALPNAGIVVALPTVAVDQGAYDERWLNKYVEAIRTLKSTIDSLDDSKIYLCPEWAMMSAISGFAYSNNAVSDAIHPLFSGRITKFNAASAYIAAAKAGV